MKRGFLAGLASAGWVFFLGLALLPGHPVIHPTGAWLAMAGCALGAWVSGSRTQKAVAMLALLVGLAGSVYCWDKNQVIYQSVRERAQHTPSQPKP